MRAFPYSKLRQIDSKQRFHETLFTYALDRYAHLVGPEWGTVLAVCANHRDALFLKRFPFREIVISGFGDRRRDVKKATDGDPRISYQEENAEALTFPSRSFDVVVCKEGLHHLPRPVSGLYEMLRCCRQAAVMIEPYESALERLLEKTGIATCYERQGRGRRAGSRAAKAGHAAEARFAVNKTKVVNPFERDNYVFRWTPRQLETILNSYYLDSDYRVDMTVGWLSKRMFVGSPEHIREVVALSASALGWIPGLRGNLLTAVILPGADVPPDKAAMTEAFLSSSV
ncbi:MAG: class I SAM-dependent methyltransferase [Actinomycetota bacterium]